MIKSLDHPTNRRAKAGKLLRNEGCEFGKHEVRFNHSIAVWACLGAALIPASAYAQDGATLSEELSAPAAAQEIVVTAQRRSEKAVNVPISMVVQSSKQLENAGVSSVSELGQVVPGLRIDGSGPYTQPSIRGVSSVVVGPGFAANIATYVDGFYRPDPLGNDISFSDAESVQILKGPQGTLFGRNSTGGAMVITTRAPSFTPAVEMKASYGNYDEAHGYLFVTGPISEQLAASVSGHLDRSDGFIHNIVSGKRVGDSSGGGVRAKLLYKPSSDASVTLEVSHSELNDPNGFLWNPYQGKTNGPIFFPGVAVTSARGEVSNNDPAQFKNDITSGFLTGKFKIGGVNLNSHTGYQHVKVGALSFDLDATPAPFGSLSFPEKNKIFTQEFDLGGKSSRFEWIGGLFYMHQNQGQNFSLIFTGAPAIPISRTRQKIDAYAAFLDGTLQLTDTIFLTAGGRYGIDKVTGTTAFAPAFDAGSVRHTFRSLDGRAIIRYQFDANSNAYISVSKGSKGGLFNTSTGDPNPVRPEKIWAYEIGYKLSRPGFRFEAAAFDYEYKDQQIVEYVGNLANVVNVAKTRVYGAEAHASYDLTRNFQINAGMSYTRGRYRSFTNAERYIFSPVSGITTDLNADASGNVTTRTPEFSGSVGLNYRQPFLDGQVDLSGTYAYQTKIYFDPFGDTEQSGYGLLNLRAAWTDPSDRWTAALYGKNVTDKKYRQQVTSESTGIFQVFGRPATYGVEVTLRY